jgi:hypothetical protein
MTDTKYDNTNKGAIFRNTDKVKDEDRDYGGTVAGYRAGLGH